MKEYIYKYLRGGRLNFYKGYGIRFNSKQFILLQEIQNLKINITKASKEKRIITCRKTFPVVYDPDNFNFLFKAKKSY